MANCFSVPAKGNLFSNQHALFSQESLIKSAHRSFGLKIVLISIPILLIDYVQASGIILAGAHSNRCSKINHEGGLKNHSEKLLAKEQLVTKVNWFLPPLSPFQFPFPVHLHLIAGEVLLGGLNVTF